MKNNNVNKKVDLFIQEGSVAKTELSKETENQNLETPVEVVSKHEVYLLEWNPLYDKNKGNDQYWNQMFIRRYRICGYPRFKDRPKLRCRLLAGFGTNHPGNGRCKFHDQEHSDIPYYFTVVKNAQRGLGLSVSEINELEPAMFDDKALSNLDEEILILRSILYKVMNSGREDPLAIESILDLIDKIVKAKQAKSKIETDKLLIDVRAIDDFVNKIIDVLKKNLGKAAYSEIMHEILGSIRLPSNSAIDDLVKQHMNLEVKKDNSV